MNFWALGGLLNGISSSVFGIFVYLKNTKSPSNRVWIVLSSIIGLWGYSYFFWQISTDKAQALFWCRSLMAAAIFIPVTFIHFLVVWLDLFKAKKRVLFVSYAISGIFLILDFSTLFVKDISPVLSFRYWPQAGVSFLPFIIFWASLAIYSCYILFQAMRTSSSARRHQIKYVLLGAIIGFSGGFTNYPLWYGIRILPYGNILVSVYVVLLSYAVIKHRLLEIELIIKKTAIFAGLFLFVSISFVGTTFLVQEFLSNVVGEYTRWLIFIFSITIITAGMRPLENLLIRLTDRFLFQKKYDYQRTLKDASEGMTLITDVKKLLNFIVRIVSKNIRVKSAGIFQFDELNNKYVLKIRRGANRKHTGYSLDKSNALVSWLETHKDALLRDEIEDWLKSERFLRQEKDLKDKLIAIRDEIQGMDGAVCVPSYSKGKLIGFLILGEKLSGDIYTQEDIHLLSTLASEVAIAIENAKNFMEVEKLREKERESYIQTVLALAQTVDEKDSYTHGHLEDVSYYGMKVAEELEVSSEFNAPIDKDELKTALSLHDIGKIGVPDAILHKNGKLTPEEWTIMKQHCEIGARIVEPIAKLRNVGNIIKHHQEKYDGTGYPDGLKGEEIPLESRIIAVVDAYHAMTSDRPYRKALPEKVALQELKNNIGTQFDPIVVAAFVRAWEKGKIKTNI